MKLNAIGSVKALGLALSFIMMGGMSDAAYALNALNDDQLGQVVGQSLFNMKYIAPGEASNPNTNMGFYRLGMEAEIQLNANINKLQLGCGGSKGAGACDIDINQLRLAGISASDATDSGPATDFVLNNPFFEMAILNPTSAANRQVVGFRVGAMEALGTMTMGSNANTTSLSDDTGITTLSGDMNVNVINATMTNVRACIGALISGICIGGWIHGSANVASYSQFLQFNRNDTIADLGPMTAQASGSLLGLTLTNTHLINTPLDNIHRIEVRDPSGATTPTKDFYISVQNQATTWQKVSTNSFAGASAAQKGWWLSIPQVVMANIVSNQQISMDGLGAIGGALFKTRVDIPAVDLGQQPVDNCYGGLTFC